MNKLLFFGECLLKRFHMIKLSGNLEGFYLMRLKHREKRKQSRNWKNMTKKKKNMMKKKNKKRKRSLRKNKYNLLKKKKMIIKSQKMKTLSRTNMIVTTIRKATMSGVKKVLTGNFITRKIKQLMKVDYLTNHMIYLIKNKLLLMSILISIINQIGRS